MALLEIKNLKKIYTGRMGGQQVCALNDVSFSVEKGEYVAIMGESGSNIMASLDKPSAGSVYLEEKDITAIRQKDICAFRRDNMGFVFQDFNLFPHLTVRKNIIFFYH